MKIKISRTKTNIPKTITFAEFVDALERNGLIQAFGTFWKYENEEQYDNNEAFMTGEQAYPVYSKPVEIGEACALGQAAINLGIDYNSLYEGLVASPVGVVPTRVINMNDAHKLPIREIAKSLRDNYSRDMNTPIVIKSYRKVTIVDE